MATSSIEGAGELLDGWTVACAPAAPGPLVAAAALLERFGAVPAPDVAVGAERSVARPPLHGAATRNAAALSLSAPNGRRVEVRVADWIGERALHESPAVPDGALRLNGSPLGADGALLPNGSPLSAYAALRAAGAAVAGARHGRSVTLGSASLARELTAALRHGGPSRPQLVRCSDGWAVARWRDEHEPRLLRAMVGPEGVSSSAATVAAAREARLLLSAVRAPAPWSARDIGDGGLAEGPRRDRRRPRVVDWTALWAGPWAAQELRRSGALVERIEHPRRRDGLLAWPAGRSWWRRLNAGKRLSLLDARRDGERARLERSLRDADVLITSMTPRALRSLGFDDTWRREHAPRLLHVELVAFEEPWADAPGLGEHAAAEAGLLWAGDDGPRTPYPWADPLLGAAALVLAGAWLASDRARGGRVRLSLERAASLAFGVDALQAAYRSASSEPPRSRSDSKRCSPRGSRHDDGADLLHLRVVA